MSQDYQLPTASDPLGDAVTSLIPGSLDALRSLFSGSTEPTNPVAYMLWADTSANLLKQRNAANNDWLTLSALGADSTLFSTKFAELANLVSSTDVYAFTPPFPGKVRRLVLVSDTTSTDSPGNELQFQLENLTQTQDLFSGTVGTDTVLGGVGGGVITAEGAYVLTPDQNATIVLGDVVDFQVTAVGAPTSLTRVSAFIDFASS